MTDRTSEATTDLKVRQPSLQDVLQSRRPNTQAIVQHAPPTTKAEPAVAAHPQPAESRERAKDQHVAPAAAVRPAGLVPHGRTMPLSRDAEMLRYPLYDRLMQVLDSQALAANTDDPNYRQVIEDMVANLIKQIDNELSRPEMLTLIPETAEAAACYVPITTI